MANDESTAQHQQEVASALEIKKMLAKADRDYKRKPAGRLIVRDELGNPQPVYGEVKTRANVENSLLSMVSLPYEGVHDPETGEYINYDKRFEGMTLLDKASYELAIKAAAGDTKATEMIFDRILGKPKQQVESLSMTMSYEQYLNNLEDEPEAVDTIAITANQTPAQQQDDQYDDNFWSQLD